MNHAIRSPPARAFRPRSIPSSGCSEWIARPPGPGHSKAAGPPTTSATPPDEHRPEAEPGSGSGDETRLERAAAAATNPHARRTT